MQKYNGRNLEGKRKYVVEPGFTIWAPEKSCLFCRKCCDIIWDYTNGPYCFLCKEDTNGEKELIESGAIGECEYFEENYEEIDKQNADREKLEEEIRELQKKIKTDPEYKKLYDDFAKYILDYILHGNYGIPEECLTECPKPFIPEEE
jgi:hypothetical protein